jgi:hypothetical protein
MCLREDLSIGRSLVEGLGRKTVDTDLQDLRISVFQKE